MSRYGKVSKPNDMETNKRKEAYAPPVTEIITLQMSGRILEESVIHDEYYGDDWEVGGED